MILLLALAGVILCGLAVRLSVPSMRRWRMAAELRGDWWSRFEREMRAYESRRHHIRAREQHH